MKPASLVAIVVLGGAGITACSGTIVAPPEDNGVGDAGMDASVPTVVPDAAIVCPVVPFKPFQPAPYKLLVPGHVCDGAQIAAYVDCVVERRRASCAKIDDDEGRFLPAFRPCGRCIETGKDEPEWGAIVITDPQTGASFLNVPGCMGLVAGDGRSTTGCGAAGRAFDECWEDSTEPPTHPVAACNEEAAHRRCASFLADYRSKCGKVLADGRTYKLCGGGENPTSAEYVTALVTQICGGAPPVDAGAD